MKKKKKAIDTFLHMEEPPILFLHIDVKSLEEAHDEVPHVKMLEIEAFSTTRYPASSFYKPVSRLFE